MKIGVYYTELTRGPGKVASNLIKGLEKIGADFSVNSEGDFNIILHGGSERINSNLGNCLIGPNLSTLPIDSGIVMNTNSYMKIIVHSDWVKNLYSRWIPEEKIIVWPVGIDTELFRDTRLEKKEYDFLIYYKRRSGEDLDRIKRFLDDKGKKYTVINYGNYSEGDFINTIKKSKYGIVVNNTESQGIAICEMLSSNIPLLVWDVKKWEDRGNENACNATSIPFWDRRCGEFFYDYNEMNEKYDIFVENEYSPRNYILSNLELGEQAKKIINYFG